MGISEEVGKTLVLCQFTFFFRFYLPAFIRQLFTVASSLSVEKLGVLQTRQSFVPDTKARARILQKMARLH